MEKAANQRPLVPLSSRCLTSCSGTYSVDYFPVSDVVIKPNQEIADKGNHLGTQVYKDEPEQELERNLWKHKPRTGKYKDCVSV